jgi:hypothetical protein
MPSTPGFVRTSRLDLRRQAEILDLLHGLRRGLETRVAGRRGRDLPEASAVGESSAAYSGDAGHPVRRMATA